MPKVQKQPKTKQEKNETNGRTKGLFAAVKKTTTTICLTKITIYMPKKEKK